MTDQLGYRLKIKVITLYFWQIEYNLINNYGIVLLNEEKYPKLNHNGAKKLAEWLLSKKGQKAIEGFKVNNQQMFFYSINYCNFN